MPAAGGPMRGLESAIRRYAGDRAGRLPTRLEDLASERSPDGEPYVRQVPDDPWGRPYSYAILVARAGRYDLRSYGPDGLPGTDDDVVSRAPAVPIE